MKNTKQGDLILDIINKSNNHPIVYEVYLECIKEIPNISLGAGYRNLNALLYLNKTPKININKVLNCKVH